MSQSSPRVQFVIYGPFLLLLLLAVGSMTAGFWLYTHQPPPPRPSLPSYYISRTSTAIRPCFGCLGADGKLRKRQTWKLGKTIEISLGEQWFAPVEDPPNPVKIDGVPMLAVHAAVHNDKPWFGFQQDLEGRFANRASRSPTPSGSSAAAGEHRSRFRSCEWSAGVPGLTFHDVRRTAIRNMVRAGISERVARRFRDTRRAQFSITTTSSTSVISSRTASFTSLTLSRS